MNLNLKELLQNPLRKRELFDKISGYQKVKWALEAAIKADNPVHILLVGPPGIGKTRFLKAISSKYPNNSYFALGGGASKEGMVDELFRKQYRFLLLDEIEDISTKDQAFLMSLMQDHELVETKKVNTRRLENYNCVVIATCNSTKKLRSPLLSRFKVIQLEAYNQEQFINVCVEQLDVEPAFASFIGAAVWNSGKKDMRECERISNMCRTEEDVLRYMELGN